MKKLLAFAALASLITLTALTTATHGDGILDLGNLFNYENQSIPSYITRDNTPANNPITDEGATLGRVLFYDKNLSVDNSIACASCHQQENAFGDSNDVSTGVAGVTPRHSMRLVNARFGVLESFFWDRRAASLEDQSTMPIQDHIEMGFSGTNGDPDLDSLIRKLDGIDYYPSLFEFAFGDAEITEERMQNALAQFVRSIQSFDTKYDVGRAQVANNNQRPPNFTQKEQMGKQLFQNAPVFDANGLRISGGLGCGGCHRAPEFDIDPNSGNNGVVRNYAPSANDSFDFTITRSPNLRDVFDTNGNAIAGLMHNTLIGHTQDIDGVLDHYNNIVVEPGNTTIDPRLLPGGNPQQLNMSQVERDAVKAFFLTLSGSNVYTDERWSDPFDANGNLTLIGATGIAETQKTEWKVYPNPTSRFIQIAGSNEVIDVFVYDLSGKMQMQTTLSSNQHLDVSSLPMGSYILQWRESNGGMNTNKFIKN